MSPAAFGRHPRSFLWWERDRQEVVSASDSKAEGSAGNRFLGSNLRQDRELVKIAVSFLDAELTDASLRPKRTQGTRTKAESNPYFFRSPEFQIPNVQNENGTRLHGGSLAHEEMTSSQVLKPIIMTSPFIEQGLFVNSCVGSRRYFRPPIPTPQGF